MQNFGVRSSRPMSTLRVALVADELTRSCLERECHVTNITPLNYRFQLKARRPDMLLVESVWQGYGNRWKFRVASYPDHPARTNQALVRVVEYAKELGIPTVFWNKEDGVHFDRFVSSARHFDHIFTVDENCVNKYRKVVAPEVTVNTLMFAAQPKIHRFEGFNFKYPSANFTGSYSHHVHDERRQWQDMLFKAAGETMGLTVFDRNSKRKSPNYRYPDFGNMKVRPAVKLAGTASIYKDFLVSLNVNTVVDSGTMFSRRLIEIIGCGGIAVTTPSHSVDRHFKDYCHVVKSYEEAHELLSRLSKGPSSKDLEMAEAGARFVAAEHTWSHRLADIAKVVGL